PTKTAVVDTAGGRTQVSQLTTAAVTLAVLLFATALIAHLPNAALAALVFFIGVRLIDMRSLCQIYQFRKVTFAVAMAALLGVVFLGVEAGIFVAVGLSILDHLRQEYHPKDVVLTLADGHWQVNKAEAGIETEPGLLVYRFQAPLFFANADFFTAQLLRLLAGVPHPVQWLVLDLVSMSDIDYTAGLTLAALLKRLQKQGLTIAVAQAADVREQLDRLGITAQIGAAYLYETVPDAVDAYHRQSG
ncbi:MAG: STAS domain-containing protein, partial [Armatimonadota bacterium]|nr:STAS domain-containing protein [Armatimonadota bacterium]